MAEKRNDKVKKTTRGVMIYHRLTILFFLAAAIAVYILTLNGNPDLVIALVRFNVPMAGLLIVGAAALLILSRAGALEKMKGGARDYRVFTPAFCAGTMTALAFALFAMRYASSQYFIIITVFAAFALVFVFYTYSREFFWLSAYTGGATVLLYFVRIFRFPPGSALNVIGEYASLAAGAVISVILFVYVIRAAGGDARAKKQLTGGADMRRTYPFYITLAVCIAGFIIRELYFAAFTYAIGALMISYFVFLLFYTIDLTD